MLEVLQAYFSQPNGVNDATISYRQGWVLFVIRLPVLQALHR